MKFQMPFSRWWLGVAMVWVGLGVFSLFPGTKHAANVTQESRERTIRRLPIERNEPIAIARVKVKGNSIFRNRKFVSDEDWLNGLTIRVKNRSDRAILFAAVELQFPRPLGFEGRIAVDDIYYGNRALLIRSPMSNERSSGIAPGQAVDIELSDRELGAIRALLAGTGYPPIIETVDLRIGRVVFEDDTMWSRGSRPREGPERSSHLD